MSAQPLLDHAVRIELLLLVLVAVEAVRGFGLVLGSGVVLVTLMLLSSSQELVSE